MLGKPLSVCVLASLEALQTEVSISKSGLVCLSVYRWGQDAQCWLLGHDLIFVFKNLLLLVVLQPGTAQCHQRCSCSLTSMRSASKMLNLRHQGWKVVSSPAKRTLRGGAAAEKSGSK